MKRTVCVTSERRIAATPDVVWAVVADPNMQERLDRRCRLEFARGDWRRAGAEFVLNVQGSRLRYVVVHAEPGIRWAADVDRGGKVVGTQSGELSSDGTATLLRWTVTMTASPLTRRLVERSCQHELPRWLAAVEDEALAAVR